MVDKRKILTKAEVEALMEENPGRVVIGVESDKDYSITVVPAPYNRNAPRKTSAYGSVSGIHQEYRYVGKKKGELEWVLG